MPIGHLATTARAHVSATAEAERDGEGQQQKQDFLVHTVSGAQAVLTAAALYERRM